MGARQGAGPGAGLDAGMGTGTQVIHASCVAVAGEGLVILGPSGAGKSALALRMIALGARLVADDRTVLARVGAGLKASAPPALRGMIEARGVGLLRAPALAAVPLALAIDLARAEDHRLPPARVWSALGVDLPLVLGPAGDALPAALMLYLAHGRSDAP